MSVLICFYGQFRSSADTWQSIKNHLINTNSADVAIVIEKHTPIPVYAQNDFKYIWKIKKITMESWKLVKNGDTVARILKASAKVFAPYAFGASKGSGTFIWVSFFHAYQHMRRLNYDTYVMTRTDFYYLCPFHIPRGRRCLHSVSIERYGGINDRHIIIPRRYLHILGIMQEMARRATLKNGLWCFQCYTERILMHMTKLWHIPSCYFPLTMFLVRDNGVSVRSKKGRGTNTTCNNRTFRVKYMKEFDFALSQCNTTCSRRGVSNKKNLSTY